MKLFLAILSLLFITAIPANAANFCLVGPATPMQCIYDDAAVCRQASRPPETSCATNPDAVLNYSGNSRYCTVSSNLAVSCIYIDRSQCNEEASRRREVCIDRIGMNDKNNPYRDDPRVQY